MDYYDFREQFVNKQYRIVCSNERERIDVTMWLMENEPELFGDAIGYATSVINGTVNFDFPNIICQTPYTGRRRISYCKNSYSGANKKMPAKDFLSMVDDNSMNARPIAELFS